MASEENFLLLARDIGTGIIAFKTDNSACYANHQIINLLGCPLNEIMGRSGKELFEHFPKIPPGSDSIQVETQISVAEGPGLWIDLTLSRYHGDNPAISLLATVSNIDERKQMEQNQALVLDILTVPYDLDFFTEVTRKLSEAFAIKIAFITECQYPGSVRTIAHWNGGQRGADKTYQLADTPCETVVGKEPAFYASQVCHLFPLDRDLKKEGAESYVGVPLTGAAGEPLGHLALIHTAPFPKRFELIGNLQIIGSRLASEIERNQKEALLESRNADLAREIAARREALSTIHYFREEIGLHNNMGRAVGQSPAFVTIKEKIGLVSKTGVSVLISGETGTGKELVARTIHEQSPRAHKPLIKVNCAALPQDLLEAELFGHEKGAFTSAGVQRKGRFELADGGTLFLDEIGELPLSAQVKLLRVLQEKEFERVGGSSPIKVDFRLIAATNRDLEAMVRSGTFRSDLFYRLEVFPLQVPPLRERKADIVPLAEFFLEKFSRTLGKQFSGIHPDSIKMLEQHNWPGNIRELENLVHRSAILSSGPLLQVGLARNTGRESNSLEDIERQHIESILAQTEGRLEGEAGAARILGLNPSTLRSRIKKLGIQRAR